MRVIFPNYGGGNKLSYLDFLANTKNAPLEAIPAHYPRVWLILAHNQLKGGEPDPTTAAVEHFLSQNYRLALELRFEGNLQARLYTQP